MTLLDLTYNWFSFLRMVAMDSQNVHITVQDMKNQLVTRMAEMEKEAESDPEAKQYFRQHFKFPEVKTGMVFEF